MRTAHLIVSGAAFAVWLASCVAYCVVCDNAVTDQWYLYCTGAVLPSFWCVYAWFATGRIDSKTSRRLMLLSVPVLVCGLGFAFIVLNDVSHQMPDGSPPPGMGVGMVGPCCWELAVPCGLVSFVWAIGRQVRRHFQPPEETEANPQTEARPAHSLQTLNPTAVNSAGSF